MLTELLTDVPSLYIVQSVLHATVSSIVTNMGIRYFKITDPIWRQRFRFIPLFIAVFSFPLYQVIEPSRSYPIWRMKALFDSDRWLHIDIFYGVSTGHIFITLIILTAFVFLFQEFIPVIKNFREKEILNDVKNYHLTLSESDRFPSSVDMTVVDDDEPLLYSTSKKEHSIVISKGLFESLNKDELKSAIAHEVAHIERNKRPVLIIVFLIRVVMFFNPAVLIEFRKITQEEEMICDDMAVSMTGNPQSLINVLKRFRTSDETGEKDINLYRIEEYSQNIILEERIRRLETGRSRGYDGCGIVFVITVIATLVINYYIV